MILLGILRWGEKAKQSKKLRAVFKMKIIDINNVLSMCAAKHGALFALLSFYCIVTVSNLYQESSFQRYSQFSILWNHLWMEQ